MGIPINTASNNVVTHKINFVGITPLGFLSHIVELMSKMSHK